MNCATVTEKLGAVADGEPSIDVEVEVHLAGCADCRRALAELRTQHAELDAAFAPLRARRGALEERVVAAARAAGGGRRRRGFAIPLLAAAAAGFLLGALVFGPWPPRERGAEVGVARLGVATGAVEVSDAAGGRYRPLATSGAIPAGSRVRTKGGAKCSLLAADGSEVRLDADSEIRAVGARSFELETGRLYALVAANAAARFEVATKEGRIEAVGTVLDIQRVEAAENDPAHVRLTVVEGTARVGSESVEAGTAAIVRGGSLARREPVHDLLNATSWVNEILALRGPGDSEFAARVDSLLAQIGRTKMAFLPEAQIRSLGDHCALPLLRHVQSQESRADAFRRRSAARILADIAPPALAIEFLALLEDADAEVRVAAAKGLARLTGETLGHDDAYWSGEDVAQGVADWRATLTRPGSPWAAPSRR